MAISLGPSESGDEDEVMSTINTTPLVDVMLVLLIIFLITIPVVTHTVPVRLPQEAVQPSSPKPGTVTLAVDRHGRVWWNEEAVSDSAALTARLAAAAAAKPQPEIHVRGDREAAFEDVGGVLTALQAAGIAKVGFITEPPPH